MTAVRLGATVSAVNPAGQMAAAAPGRPTGCGGAAGFGVARDGRPDPARSGGATGPGRPGAGPIPAASQQENATEPGPGRAAHGRRRHPPLAPALPNPARPYL
jgi:hypothetical protein